jgi:hypothetical protein
LSSPSGSVEGPVVVQVFNLDPPFVVDQLIPQLIIQEASRKRLALKGRAALGCTVDGKMDPGILEPFSQDIVFNLVQGQQSAVDAGDGFFPGR